MYEALTAFDTEMQLQPALATRWLSRDDLTWGFELRPGVRFHDGRLLGAEDVVASLDRARRPGSKTAPYLVGLRTVRALDAHTVEVITERPNAILVKKLAFVAIVPRGAPEEIRQPLGTGPYRFVRFAPASGFELQAWQGYWGGAPAVQRASIMGVEPGEERRRRLVGGEADLVASLDARDVDAVRRVPGLRVAVRPSLTVAYLGLRCDRPPFADRRVRQALHLALDREALAAAMRGGLAQPAGQFVDREVFGYDPGLPVPERDLVGARRLLEQAGLRSLDVDLEFRPGFDVAPLVAQLAEAGIRLRPAPRPWPELVARRAAGRVDLYLGGMLCPAGDASDVLDNDLHSPDAARGYGGSNFLGYASPALDELIEKSGSTFNIQDRSALLQRCMRLAMDELPLVPLYVPTNAFGLRAGLAWRPRLDGFIRIRSVSAAP